ncbi:MAG: hypothetical protein MUE81_08200, partial [Thermoflexibacter sp.]|nr:hypothetical protein [Thermoflexibacter sp.]
EGFTNGYHHYQDLEEEPVYQKAKYNNAQEDLAEKFVTSKQYNSVNFKPVIDRSSKNKQVENKAKSEVYKQEKQEKVFVKVPPVPQENKLKTTPKINKVEEDETLLHSKNIKNSQVPNFEIDNKVNRSENFSKRFREESQQESLDREVVFNVAAKVEPAIKHNAIIKPVMTEQSSPQKVAGGYKIACAHCGKETIKKSKTAKFCTTACRVAHNKEAGINDDGNSPAFYLVKDDFDNSGVIEWANTESI